LALAADDRAGCPAEEPPDAGHDHECTTCDTRFVGERRCPECNLFNRRVDLGGHCPECDEPVAIADLAEGR
jgi:transcription initiation factor IIE alpha subunit